MRTGLGPWMDLPHAAEHAGYPDALSNDQDKRKRAMNAFWMWAKRSGVQPSGRRGRRPLFSVVELDRAIETPRSRLRRAS